MKFFFTLLLLVISVRVFGQTYPINGTITDNKDNAGLPGATVVFTRLPDSVQAVAISDAQGRFQVNSTAGNYLMRVTFLGYQTLQRRITITGPLNLGTLGLQINTKQLGEVQVTGRVPVGEQKGDTAQFNARAFKTNPDANAEDLVQKMPGVTVQDGQVKAQGENVGRVLVDGKEFFGDDAQATLRNLPAEVVDKIQVFDQQSEQSRLTGFNDGNTVKTINIVTRPNMRQGQFGKIYAGAGTDGRYQLGGNINIFKGDQRISILGQSNSINQQNFSSEDLVGVMSSGGNRGGRGGGGGGRGGDGNFGGGGGSDFRVPQMGGINRTHAAGINYSDKWGQKVTITGSYFINQSNNKSAQSLYRQYIDDLSDTSEVYVENQTANSQNTNHRFNMRLEYAIDSANTIFFRPRLSLQTNDGTSDSEASTLSGTRLDNQTTNNFTSDLTGYNFAGELIFRHQFAKRGRTLSLGVNSAVNNNAGQSYLLADNRNISRNRFYIQNQFAQLDRNGWSISPNINYTEPLSKKSQLQLNYSTTFQQTDSDKRTFDYSDADEDYAILNPALSNTFYNQTPSQQAGVGYRFQAAKYNFFTRVSYQYSRLESESVFPNAINLKKRYNNLVPFAMFQYNFSRQKNLRLFYRTNTNTPSVDQLQPVADISNPILPRIGNPNLDQSFQHNLNMRYSASNLEKSTTFFALVSANIIQNSIVNHSFRTLADTVIFNQPILGGTRVAQPVNLNGQYLLNSFLTYGMPLKFIKSNLNFNLSGSYNHSPGLVDNKINYSDSENFGLGATLSSNISERLDFTFSSTTNINYTQYSLESNQDTRYYNQNFRGRLNWIFWKDFVLQGDFTRLTYSGLTAGYNQNYNLLNLSLGKKLFKNKNGDIRLSVFDALEQNNSIQRNVTATYIEDVESLVLQRYYMLTFTYNIRRFGAGGGNGLDGAGRPDNNIRNNNNNNNINNGNWGGGRGNQ